MSKAHRHPVHLSHRRLRIVAAAVVVTALIAGSVAAVLWFSRPADTPPRPDRMLAGTYPTEPEFAWTWPAPSSQQGGNAGIATPVFGVARYASPGAIVAGDHVIIQATPGPGSTGGAQLLSLALADGHLRWSVPLNLGDGCARELLGDTLPCTKSAPDGTKHELQFLDMNTGATVFTARIPFTVSTIATDGEHLYTGGHDDRAGLAVASGSNENPLGDWNTVVPQGHCGGHGGGDAMNLHVEQGLVWGFLSGGSEAALRASDGSALFDHDVTNVSVLDGPPIAAVRCQDGVEQAGWPTEVVDGQGRTLFTSAEPLHTNALEVHTGGLPPFVTADGDVLDAATGQTRLLIARPPGRAELPYPTWLIGSILVVPDDGITAYDLRTGQKVWHNPTAAAGSDAVTDGRHVLTANNHGGIDAITLADGSLAWSSGTGAAVGTLHETRDGSAPMPGVNATDLTELGCPPQRSLTGTRLPTQPNRLPGRNGRFRRVVPTFTR